MEHKDALGDPIVIGRKYGYAINKNGFTHVITGLAHSCTEQRVTLTVLSAVKSLYNDKPAPTEFKEHVTIKSINLFPVRDKFDKIYDEMVAKLRFEMPELTIEEIDEAISAWCHMKKKEQEIAEFARTFQD